MKDVVERQYISFERQPLRGKTSRWLVINNRHGDELGVIRWYGAWRQYTFEAEPECVFSAGCLDDIRGFIRELMAVRKEQHDG